MPFSAKDTDKYREDAKSDGRLLRAEEREELLKPYLPKPPPSPTLSRERRKEKSEASHFGFRRFLRQQLYVLSYALIHIIFSFYIRVRIAYHAVAHRIVSVLRYHHRTPEYIQRDVRSLPKIPQHVSVILTLEEGGKRGDAKEKMLNEVADITAWCASAGITMLTVFERTGALKDKMDREHREISQKLRDWFGTYQAPELHLHSPNMPVIGPPNYRGPKGTHAEVAAGVHDIGVNFISADDGRESIVDLTKVLTDMSQRGKLSAPDITSDIIDHELKEVMAEPDLLISFAPFVDLQGYPPWQIRLTEIYCQEDNQGVGYQVFLNALRKYAAATFKLGK
ncbi:Decaprenyl diphosphate synthase-like protein [Xylariales sp. AK1849]|nr:Decaprenyl diphosphate synthase-like protein [Xylariales sp. AK1849]